MPKHNNSKKGNSNDTYSHPLIKNLQQPQIEDHTRIIPTYQPFIATHQNRTSSKLIRYTTLTPSNNSDLSIFINPFHPEIEELPIISSVSYCVNCKCVMNPLSKVNNYSELICNLCDAATQKKTLCDQQCNYHAYQCDSEILSQCQNESKDPSLIKQNQFNDKRKICFVIQASQQNFERGVHKGIINCLIALKDQDIWVSIIFFNSNQIMFLDIGANQLTKVTLNLDQPNPLEGWDDVPVGLYNLFHHIRDFNEQTIKIIADIMYEAFLITFSLIVEVTQMSKVFLSTCNCQIKFFITTLNKLGSKHQQEIQSFSYSKIFKQTQNIIPKIIEKTQLLNFMKKRVDKKSIAVSQNMQFFILNVNTNYGQSINLLGYTICKIYNINKENSKVEQSIYYDLFENIQKTKYHHTYFYLKCSINLQIYNHNTQTYNLYGNVSIQQQKIDKNYRVYRILLRRGDQSTMIPIKFKVSGALSQSPFFQLDYSFSQHNLTKRLILNGGCHSILKCNQIGSQWLDDQALFNDNLRKVLSSWDKQNFQQLKSDLQDQYRYILYPFKAQSKENSINFPLNMKHYFLYSFILSQQISNHSLSFYNIYKLITSNLQQFSKQLYLRTYRLDKQQLRNIKTTYSIFQKYSVIFMENGQYLFMIFNDTPVEQIKQVFGYFDSFPVLAKCHFELPQLSSNQKYRRAVETIRASNCNNFLPLKIIERQSHQFQCLIRPFLYIKQDHTNFLKKMWKNS